MALPALIDSLSPERPVAVAGPTAAGKSALALAIARAQGRSVVNADALQVYGCWRVLTDRPGEAALAAAPHRLYGHVGWDQAYSVGHWLREVAGLLATPAPAAPVFVGGSGLYLSALTEGLADIPPTDPAVRAEAEARRAEDGLDVLARELDPATRARIDLANPARVQRAWEVLRQTGRGLAAWQAAQPAPLVPPAQAHLICLEAPRDWLAARIDARLAGMLRGGVLDEVRAVLPAWDPRRPAAQAIGAAPFVALLRGEITESEALARAAAQSRQYAKRQRTWFRRRMRHWRRRDSAEIAQEIPRALKISQ